MLMTSWRSLSPAQEAALLKRAGELHIGRKRRDQPEHRVQSAAFAAIRAAEATYPVLQLIYAVPNGGKRGKLTAVQMWREGARAGMPDINVDVPRWGYHGLRIEVKIGTYPSPEQILVHQHLEAQGYCVVVIKGKEAQAYNELLGVVAEYLGLPPFWRPYEY